MTKSRFRLLIIANWSFTLLALAASIFGRRTLPDQLQEYLKSRSTTAPSTYETVSIWIAFASIVFAIVVSIGIFLIKRWGRALILPSYALTYVLICADLVFNPTRPVYIQTGLTNLLFSLSYVAGGVILALVFFSPPIAGLFANSTRRVDGA